MFPSGDPARLRDNHFILCRDRYQDPVASRVKERQLVLAVRGLPVPIWPVAPIVKWASEKFGEDDPFTRMLVTEHEWIEEVIRRRNAVEHPGGHSGTLYIQNFTRLEDGRYVTPTWNRDDGEPKGLYPDIEVILDNLLTLAEELLVSCNVHRSKHKIIQYAEIPEDKRNPECPKRLIVQLKEGIGVAKVD